MRSPQGKGGQRCLRQPPPAPSPPGSDVAAGRGDLMGPTAGPGGGERRGRPRRGQGWRARARPPSCCRSPAERVSYGRPQLTGRGEAQDSGPAAAGGRRGRSRAGPAARTGRRARAAGESERPGPAPSTTPARSHFWARALPGRRRAPWRPLFFPAPRASSSPSLRPPSVLIIHTLGPRSPPYAGGRELGGCEGWSCTGALRSGGADAALPLCAAGPRWGRGRRRALLLLRARTFPVPSLGCGRDTSAEGGVGAGEFGCWPAGHPPSLCVP